MGNSPSNIQLKFSLFHLPKLLKQTFKEWKDDDPWRLSAIVAYYAVFSLPGLLVVLINVVGAIWGTEIVEGKLTHEIANALGQNAADSIQEIIASTQGGNKSVISTIIGIATLIFGATGVFYHLQLSLNKIWGIEQAADAGIKRLVFDRLLGFGFVMVVGLILLISFVLSAVLTLLNGYLESIFPQLSIYLARVLNELLSLGVSTVLFALLFKYLPDASIKWRSVWVGGFLTAILFTIGKFLLGIYFGTVDPSSVYGAAGSMILVLLWVSYSCLILFFGAEFTWVYAEKYGFSIEPSSHAKFINEHIPVKNNQEIRKERINEKQVAEERKDIP